MTDQGIVPQACETALDAIRGGLETGSIEGPFGKGSAGESVLGKVFFGKEYNPVGAGQELVMTEINR